MSMSIWFKDPSVLLKKNNMFDVWPTKTMEYNEKINAIVRLVILLTFIGILLTRNIRFLIIGMITLGIIYIICKDKSGNTEGFSDRTIHTSILNKVEDSGDVMVDPLTLKTLFKKDYQVGTTKNPFGNVLLPEIIDTPNRKPATPSFTPEVAENITTNTKKLVQELNPTIKNTDKQLFGNLTDEFYLDQSNRQFFSTANTRVANDQGAFAQYLYGDMPSCRDGDGMACVQDNYRYILI